MKIEEKNVVLKTGKTVLLRSPLPEDAPIVLEHLRRVFKEHYRNFNRPGEYWDSVTVEEEAKIISSIFEDPNQFMIGAFDEGKAVGMLAVMSNSKTFHKNSGYLGMGIETEYQNSGLGTELMKHCFEEAKKTYLHSIQLEVRTFNHAAIGLYEKMGFRRVGEMKEIAFIDGQYYDEYIYQKLLAVSG